MATPYKSLPRKRGQPTASLRTKCANWLLRMEEQKTLAREMIQTVREMCHRAAKMKTPPRLVLP